MYQTLQACFPLNSARFSFLTAHTTIKINFPGVFCFCQQVWPDFHVWGQTVQVLKLFAAYYYKSSRSATLLIEWFRYSYYFFRCREFNVLGMTHFGSLAAHAIKVWEWNRWAAKLNFTKISPAEVNCDQLQPKVSCDKFSLAYNWFGRLHDSSFEVDYHLNHHHHHHLWGCHFQLPGRVWFVRHPREHVQQFGRKAFLGFATSSPWAGCSLSTLL